MRKGDKFMLGGLRYRCVYVNECRAHCQAVVTQRHTITTRAGDARTFSARRRVAIDVAPGTDPALVTEMLGAAPGAQGEQYG